MKEETGDQGGGNPTGEQRSPGTRRPVGLRRIMLAALGFAAAVGLAAGLTLTFAPGSKSDEESATAGTKSGMADVTADTADLANYAKTLSASTDQFFGTLQRAELLELSQNPMFERETELRIALAFDYLRFGEADESLGVLTKTLEIVEEDGGDPKRVLAELAVASLKASELSNRVNPSARLVCTLPLGNELGYQDPGRSNDAIKYFLRLLEIEPDNVKYRWLLNVTHMTLGTYPEDVPERFLIPRELLDSGYDIGRFEEIAADMGLNAANLAGGSIMDDFDNDGLLDIITSTWDPGGSIIYYHNDGDGKFSDQTAQAGIGGQLGGLNIVQTDYNNDGLLDVLVMRGGWLRDQGQMRVSLLRSNGDGGFSDVTRQAGLARPGYPSQSAAWADYDNDGDLDLYSCNESERPFKYPSQLFRNEGDGTFVEDGYSAGVQNMRYCKGSVWGDYDNDGDPDLYVSNFEQKNRLYRNNGDGTFTDVAPELGVTEPVPSFATWFWDYNNDGWLDLWVAGYGSKIRDVAADYLGVDNDGGRMRLYRNDGAGGFIDVTKETGLYRVHLSMAANFGDMDNDGFPDFYLGTGYPSYDVVGPNIAYRNNEGRSFSDVTFSAGLGHLHKGHGIAFGDLDRDGDQDIFAQMGGFYPGDDFENALYENPGHGNHWVSARLIGVQSNRAAIGARIKVDLTMTDSSRREVYARVGSGGSFGASSLEQEIGLGKAQRIESMEVFWPTSGIRQVFEDVPLDTRIEVREGEKEFEAIETRPIKLGGK